MLAITDFHAPFLYSLDEDDGQFEPEEEEVDKQRKLGSESPINKVMPIPEGSAFWVFSKDNQ